ncbi:MAG: hypothetical protein HYS27_08030 [Deltaproteobacteria bacterium]|nr:hypothetical protein [Deltaproteobacteria bacterium]
MLIRACLVVLVLGAPLLVAGCPAPTPPPNVFTPNEHLRYFPIGPGATHELDKAVEGSPVTETITCDACHSGSARFAEFNCLNCHGTTAGTLEAGHELVNGFERDSDKCYRCHEDGRRGVHIEPPAPPPPEPEPGVDAGPPPPPPETDHDNDDFPYSEGTPHGPDNAAYMGRAEAQGLSHCAACHADGANRTLTRCAECHAYDDPATDTLHTGRLSNAYDAVNDCKECHWTTPLPSELSMANHDNASCTDHFGAQCFDCHDQDARQGQPKTWAIDFGFAAEPVACTACHGQARDYPAPCD